MTVFVVYEHGSPQGMKVFASRPLAQRFVLSRLWPRNFVIRERKLKRR